MMYLHVDGNMIDIVLSIRNAAPQRLRRFEAAKLEETQGNEKMAGGPLAQLMAGNQSLADDS